MTRMTINLWQSEQLQWLTFVIARVVTIRYSTPRIRDEYHRLVSTSSRISRSCSANPPLQLRPPATSESYSHPPPLRCCTSTGLICAYSPEPLVSFLFPIYFNIIIRSVALTPHVSLASVRIPFAYTAVTTELLQGLRHLSNSRVE